MLALLVVLHHTAITYGAIGAWFYRDRLPDAAPASTLLVFFCTLNQAYFMGLFFLLAGFYTPEALARDGPRRFLATRGLRLGLPLLAFGLVLGPATIALAQTTHGRPFAASLLALWRAGTVEVGPLWFALARLVFSALAALWPSAWQRGWQKSGPAPRRVAVVGKAHVRCMAGPLQRACNAAKRRESPRPCGLGLI